MPIRILAALLLAIVAMGRPASANFLLIGSNPTTEVAVPFGLAGDGSNASNRYQQVFSSSLFNGPISITALTLYAQGQGAGGTYESVTYNIRLSTTGVGVGALSSSNFDSNAGANAGLFAKVNPTGSAASTWNIAGISPFLYNASQGNLLLDIQIPDQVTDPNFFGASFDGQANYGPLSSSVDNFGGNVSTSGLTLGITYSAVPEPASLALGLLGLGIVAAATRSHRD